MKRSKEYLMESPEEIIRLERKTDIEVLRRQALWCGIKPGQRVLDVACGPGKTTSILYEMVQPGGHVVGIDFSRARISHARKHYGGKPGIDFFVHDFRDTMEDMGNFDVIWVRFILEYYRKEGFDIVGNLKLALKKKGYLCLADLDYNCLSHYELPHNLKDILPKIMARLDEKYNFDTYAGRKLYAYLYDHGFENIEACLMAHHLIYGKIKDHDAYNWMKKVEVNAAKFADLFKRYPGGYEEFIRELNAFFHHPRRFTYTPLILCKGRKPRSA
jgi:SAM-dependent methyltransferase